MLGPLTVTVGGVFDATNGLIVTVNSADAERPDASRAVQLTVVVPTGNSNPGVGLHPTMGVERLSVAAGNA